MVRRPFAAALLAAVGAVVITLSGCADVTAVPAATTGPAVTRITVASEECGAGWSNPRAGRQDFLLSNTDIVSAEVFLVDAHSGDVYAYVDDIAPGATAVLRLALGSGRYSFRCAMSDEGVARGRVVIVPGTTAGSRPVEPVTDNDLIPVVKAYDAWVTASLPQLGTLVTTLDSDIRHGDLAAARSAWLPAHLAYERLGAAYGAFGTTDTAIDGLATGLDRGVSDPAFSGFHRLEYGLWHAQSASALVPVSRGLVANIASLKPGLEETPVSTLDIAVRTHEIAENALQFDLSGQSDYGSGTSLASVRAELAATGELLRLMSSILRSRYPALGEAEQSLGQAIQDVDAQRVSGRWTSLDRLGTAAREQIDSDVSGLATLLAPVASICEPRITS